MASECRMRKNRMPDLIGGSWRQSRVAGLPSLQTVCVDSTGSHGHRVSLLLHYWLRNRPNLRAMMPPSRSRITNDSARSTAVTYAGRPGTRVARMPPQDEAPHPQEQVFHGLGADREGCRPAE